MTAPGIDSVGWPSLVPAVPGGCCGRKSDVYPSRFCLIPVGRIARVLGTLWQAMGATFTILCTADLTKEDFCFSAMWMFDLLSAILDR